MIDKGSDTLSLLSHSTVGPIVYRELYTDVEVLNRFHSCSSNNTHRLPEHGWVIDEGSQGGHLYVIVRAVVIRRLALADALLFLRNETR